MKHLIMTGMFFVLAFAPLSAEVIQTINFNPARLGQYERLKVSEKATFQGGLTAQSMQVRSGGTVSINESNSGALAYDIPLLYGRKGKQTDDVVNNFPAEPTLDFPGTCFSSLENCVGSNTTGNLNVKFNGGAASFKGPAGYNDPASRINQITTDANRLRLESVYATVKGKLNITGVGTYSYRNLSASTPLRLAGNWVPLPSVDGVGARTLKWETRKTVKHPDKGGESVQILVLEGSGGGPNPPSCTPQTCSPQPCPNGQTGQINYTWNQSQCKCVESSRTCSSSSNCSDASYKASHKSECCPTAPYSDTVCWTNKASWKYIPGSYKQVAWEERGNQVRSKLGCSNSTQMSGTLGPRNPPCYSQGGCSFRIYLDGGSFPPTVGDKSCPAHCNNNAVCVAYVGTWICSPYKDSSVIDFGSYSFRCTASYAKNGW